MEGTQQGNSGVFSSIHEAVAELDRRDAAKAAETKKEAPKEAETEEPKAEKPLTDDSDSSPEQAEESDEVATDEDKKETEQAKTSIEFDGKTLEIPAGTPPELVQAAQKLANDLKSDYTKKTQAVAEERKVIERAKERALSDFQQLQQSQQALAQMAQALIGAEPDLALAQSEPHTYLVQKSLYEQRVNQFRALMAQGEELTKRQQEEQLENVRAYQQAQVQELLKAMPELQQPEKFQAFRAKAIEAGSKYGFSADEISGLADHRMVLALRDLAKFHAQQKQAGEVKDKLQNVPPKVAKPGATQQGDSKNRDYADAKREFMKSPRTDRDLKRFIARTS